MQESRKKFKKCLDNRHQIQYNNYRCPGVAQFGSALEWGSRGREFDSRHSDQSHQLFSWWLFCCSIVVFMAFGDSAHIFFPFSFRLWSVTNFQTVLNKIMNNGRGMHSLPLFIKIYTAYNASAVLPFQNSFVFFAGKFCYFQPKNTHFI